MELLLRDLRYALRTLARTPGFVAVTLLTLMLGIGANLAIFTVVHAVLLRPLPITDPDRVVRIFDDFTGTGASNVGLSVPEMQDIETSGVFSQVSGIWAFSLALGGAGEVQRVEMLATRLMAAMLVGVDATDPVTFMVVPIVLLLVAAIACLVPGRRAARVPPIRALRGEA